MSDLDAEIRAAQEARGGMGSADKVALGKAGAFDTDIYSGDGKDGYANELPTAAEEEAREAASSGGGSHPATKNAVKASKSLLEQGAGLDEGHDPFQQYRESGGSGLVNTRISDREGEYRQQRLNRMLSPSRGDKDVMSGQTPARSYKEIMQQQQLDNERKEVMEKIAKKQEEEAEARKSGESSRKRKNRWDDGSGAKKAESSEDGGGGGRWDATPKAGASGGGGGGGDGGGKWDATPGAGGGKWDATPGAGGGSKFDSTPSGGGSKWDATPGGSKWDATPGGGGSKWDATPGGKFDSTPSGGGSKWDATPGGSKWDSTPGGGASKWDATPGGASKWDSTPGGATPGRKFESTPSGSRWDATPNANKWDATPKAGSAEFGATPSRWDATPKAGGDMKKNRWDETPTPGGQAGGETPSGRKRSRWDETPLPAGQATPAQSTPSMYTPSPHGGMATPDGGGGLGAMTPEMAQRMRWEREIEERNRPLTDDELDCMFPTSGYKILEPPASYVPIRTPARKLLATPTPMGQTPGFQMGGTPARDTYGIPATPNESALPHIKPEDYQYFGKLMDEQDEDELSPEEQKERKILKLLLKIKNGTPPQRKTALRQITDKAREFGAGALFNQILPLLMSPTLEDQERHLLVKVIDRILYKLDDLVRPYVHKILVVIEPLLIDEDYYARVEGREIISNLAKAAGLATMIATMRPDIDNLDEYVRNTTARAFAVVASALGIPALLPFLKAVCQSRKSWQARHTGIKIVQQIAILMGCAVLPHLKHLVEIVEHGLIDEQQKVRTITALSLAAMAEAAHPYGIESFDSVLRPLWKGIRQHRGKGLAAFLKAIGFIIPLMDANYANYYTQEVMVVLIREFQSPDEEMKKIVLKVVKQCVQTDGVEPDYIKSEVLPEFFKNFWVRRMALDRRNYKQLVETTVEVSHKVGVTEVVGRVVDDLKDESEPYRRMVMETIEKIIQDLGAVDVDERLEEQLIDGILYAFQEQTSDDTAVMLNGFGTVVNALGLRVKPYLPQICGTIKWRLNNKAAKVRMQAADLIARCAVVMKSCQEEQLMGHLGVVLYEYLGEEYPEVLGSILGALKAIVNVIGMTKMTPPIKDLLPRLTPILKNRHEKVQENCIDLVGRIADRGAEFVSPREWMRICFELLEMLKAHKKGIRRAAVNTFGYIAKAIGPQDVLHTLLNNLKVQERQNRVCTTVAIAIVAETCSPFTVLPALMNEYRVPELNVQNGVLKALSFMFEYIGEMAKDYIYAVTPMLEDALMDRDLVHRQTAATTVKHLALGCVGLGCEDALLHLMNHVWPNIFETSPHVINAMFEAIEGCRVALGIGRIFQYVMQGLYHPARRVREVYWKLYNSLYMYGVDQLTAFYPRMDDDGVNMYKRTYMELMV